MLRHDPEISYFCETSENGFLLLRSIREMDARWVKNFDLAADADAMPGPIINPFSPRPRRLRHRQ